MHRPRLRVAVLILSVGVGCGGGKPARSGPPLTKDVFVAKGNAICQQVENRINDFSASLQTTRGDLRKLADFLSAQAQQLEDDLRALNPPVADRATVDSMLDDFHASVPILKEFADALSKGNPLEQIDWTICRQTSSRSRTDWTPWARHPTSPSTAMG